MDFTAIFADHGGASWLLITIIVGTFLVFLLQAFIPRMDSHEPPSIKPTVPFVGHLIGLLRHQKDYFKIVNQKHSLPIFTLPILNGKLYVVSSPDLAQSFLRVGREFDFENFLVDVVGKRINGISPEGLKVWSNIPEDKREPYLLKESGRAINKYLSPGPYLHDTTLAAISKFVEILQGTTCPKEVNLYIWLRNALTVATTFATYGPHDPLSNDPSLVDAQWTFEQNSAFILTGLFPSIFARKALQAQAKLFSAYVEYYRDGHNENPKVSSVIKTIGNVYGDRGLPKDDIAKTAIGFIFGATSNTAPNFFWLVLHIFADPALKDEIKAELLEITTTTGKDETGRVQKSIDLANIATQCPTLYSCLQEILRLKQLSVNTRIIEADTILSDQQNSYLVKKGYTIQLPTGVPHRAPDVWGSTAHLFDGKRFLKASSRETSLSSEAEKEQERLRKKAYMPFSGGLHLCPGRHFATTEILAAAAVLVLGYELTTPQGRTIVIPPHPERSQRLTDGVVRPSPELEQMRVRIQKQKGFENVAWKFEYGARE